MRYNCRMKYIDVTQRVLNYIEENIFENYTLEQLSERFAFSMFHFNRIFRAASGEPLMEYVRRRKLDVAAESLREGRAKIIEVAMQMGFGSQEAFSRAFKKIYGLSPGRFVKKRPDYERYGRIDLVGLKNIAPPPEMIGAPEKVKSGGFCVVGIKKLTPVKSGYKKEFMNKLWARLLKYEKRLPAAVSGGAYCGICACKGGDKFSYLAGVMVSGPEAPQVGKPFEVFKAAPSDYLKIRFRGGFDELAKIHKYIYASWLPDSNFVSSACHNVELYHDFPLDGKCRGGESAIMIPV